MTFESLSSPTMVIVSLTAALLLLSRDWRVSVVTLAVQYSGVFVLTALSWPLEMAAVKLVAGWMACAILGLALMEMPRRGREEISPPLSHALFRLLAAVLMGLMVLSVAPTVATWIPTIALGQTIGGLMLFGLGLLQLGLTEKPLGVTLGLLTVLSGFEILYAVVESSTLVSGLLACVHLGLALAGGYLLAGETVSEVS